MNKPTNQHSNEHCNTMMTTNVNVNANANAKNVTSKNATIQDGVSIESNSAASNILVHVPTIRTGTQASNDNNGGNFDNGDNSNLIDNLKRVRRAIRKEKRLEQKASKKLKLKLHLPVQTTTTASSLPSASASTSASTSTSNSLDSSAVKIKNSSSINETTPKPKPTLTSAAKVDKVKTMKKNSNNNGNAHGNVNGNVIKGITRDRDLGEKQKQRKKKRKKISQDTPSRKQGLSALSSSAAATAVTPTSKAKTKAITYTPKSMSKHDSFSTLTKLQPQNTKASNPTDSKTITPIKLSTLSSSSPLPSSQSSVPISFPINEECTSLSLTPSGRQIVAGFTDGTLRLFDTTNRLWKATRDQNLKQNSTKSKKSKSQRRHQKSKSKTLSSSENQGQQQQQQHEDLDALFDIDSSSDESEPDVEEEEETECDFMDSNIIPSTSTINTTGTSTHPDNSTTKKGVVMSKSFQNFGAVACQIHARGVITSLMMNVDCCEDGLFAFGGVMRGSTELVAVDLSNLELYHDQYRLHQYHHAHENRPNVCILDLIKVYRYSDAKLKGFGACTRLKNSSGLMEYRLFTGKGIKNMHIWSFIPPQGDKTEPTWQCLYDTPTNGNTITYLNFRNDSNGLLQGISKSDDQKLRIWDLSFEQKDGDDSNDSVGNSKQIPGPSNSNMYKKSVIKQLSKKAAVEAEKTKNGIDTRPKRPPYIDVLSTENALGVFGPFVFSGGDTMYHKMGVMFLDVEDIQSPFNHTELALPNGNGGEDSVGSGTGSCNQWSGGMRRGARSGRQQRGDLRSVVSVAGDSSDAANVILELSDGSMVHYNNPKGSQSSVTLLPSDLFNFNTNTNASNSTSFTRKICISRIRTDGVTILSNATYDSNTCRGNLTLRYLSRNAKVSFGDQVTHGFSEVSNQSSIFVNASPPSKTEDKKRVMDKSYNIESIEKKQKRSRKAKNMASMKQLVSPDPKCKTSVGPVSTMDKLSQVSSPVSKSKSNLVEEKSPPDKKCISSQSVASGPTVSPEQRMNRPEVFKSMQNVKENDAAVSITKFFKPGKEVKLSGRKIKRTKKVQFKEVESTQKVPSKEVEKRPKEQSKQLDKVQNDVGKLQDKRTKEISGQKGNKLGKINPSNPVDICAKPTIELDVASILYDMQTTTKRQTRSRSLSLVPDPVPNTKNTKEQKDLEEFLSSCRRRKRPKLLQTAVSSRTEFPMPFYQKTGTFANPLIRKDLRTMSRQHHDARREMALNHRASHERLRNAVFASADRVMNIALSCDESSKSKGQILDEAKTTLATELQDYKETLRDMIERQQMEAAALGSVQTMENKGRKAPELQVSFPFPEVFEYTHNAMIGYLTGEKL